MGLQYLWVLDLSERKEDIWNLVWDNDVYGRLLLF